MRCAADGLAELCTQSCYCSPMNRVLPPCCREPAQPVAR
jgi:hypothetical protein